MSDRHDIISKRLVTGIGPIGTKGIKPISGRFKPKKCVKTVSYRGRPRYICPASGGEKAIRSLENLPVKPEDTPRRLKEIQQFAPEEQYTPKQQREEPEKIKEALFKKPETIHFDSPKEAGPDTEHDHLHFHSPEEAKDKESDAIILKEDKKKSKKDDDEDVKKSVFLSESLFKSKKALKHRRPKAKRSPAPKRRRASSPPTKRHKAAPPVKVSRPPAKHKSTPTAHPSITKLSGGGYGVKGKDASYGSYESAYSQLEGGPPQSTAPPSYGGVEAEEFVSQGPHGVRELAAGGFVTPTGTQTYTSMEEALAGAGTEGQQDLDKKLEEENWQSFKTVNAGLANPDPGKYTSASYSKYKYPKSFRLRSGNKVVNIDTTSKEFRDNVKRFFYTKSKHEFGGKDYDSPKKVLNEYLKYFHTKGPDTKQKAFKRRGGGYEIKSPKEPKSKSRASLKEAIERVSAKGKHQTKEEMKKLASEAGRTDEGYDDPADQYASKRAAESTKALTQKIEEERKAKRQAREKGKPTFSLGVTTPEIRQSNIEDLGYDPSNWGPGGPNKAALTLLENADLFIPGMGLVKLPKAFMRASKARVVLRGALTNSGAKVKVVSKPVKPGTKLADGSVVVTHLPDAKGKIALVTVAADKARDVVNSLKGVSRKAVGVAKREWDSFQDALGPSPVPAGGPSRFQAFTDDRGMIGTTRRSPRKVKVEDLFPKKTKEPVKFSKKQSLKKPLASKSKSKGASKDTPKKTAYQERLEAQRRTKKKEDQIPEELKGDTSLDTSGSRFSKKQKAAAAASLALFGSPTLRPSPKGDTQSSTKAEAKPQTQTTATTDVDVDLLEKEKAKESAKKKEKEKKKKDSEETSKRRRKGLPLLGADDAEGGKEEEREEEEAFGGRKSSSGSKGDLEAAILAAKKRHKEAAGGDPHYSKIGVKRRIRDIIKQQELGEGVRTTPRTGPSMRKSQAFVAPFVRRVMNRKMSLKEALDRVPWWMQDDLLDGLRNKKRKRRGK